jgi:choline-sulfatase
MRPNILFIMADQFRADAIGCVGGYARTPNLDKLAERGWLFKNAFANSVQCVPSRISLAAGLYPHQTGVDRNIVCTLDPDRANWMQAIAASGYRTSFFGKSHLHPHFGDIRDRLPLMRAYGFQTVDETIGPRAAMSVRSNMTDLWEKRGAWTEYRAEMSERLASRPYTARASSLPLDLYYDCYVGRVAREHLEAMPANDPWFCCVSFGGPHEPWDCPEPYASMYAPKDMPSPRPRSRHKGGPSAIMRDLYARKDHSPDLSPAEIAAMRASYAGSVTLIDDQVGQIIACVRSRGELERTLVVFTSDHGEMNGDHGLVYKGNFFDPVVKVPLVIAPPSDEHSSALGIESDALIELMDVGVTIAAYAGAEVPGTVARSLRGLVEGHVSEHRPIVLSEFSGHSCVITPEIKVVFDPSLDAVLAFDRTADADEQEDLCLDQRYLARFAASREWLVTCRTSTPPVPNAVRNIQK